VYVYAEIIHFGEPLRDSLFGVGVVWTDRR